MKRILTILSLFYIHSSIAQNNAIAAGEKLVFTASYNMSGIMNDLAQITMETSEVKTSKATLLRLKCRAATYSKWNGFFKIRDLYESYVSPKTLKPYLYKRDIYEGGYTKLVQYNYKHKSGTVKSLIRKKRRDGGTYDKNNTISISKNTRDIVTTLYYLRTIDFSSMLTGESKTLTIIFDNKEHDVNFKYISKEIINTSIGNKSCYKISISVSNNNVLEGANNNLIWLTADENKIPVFAKFKIAVGNGELKIESASGLKN